MPLHLTYRPQMLNDLYGNLAVKNALSSILGRSDRPKAYLISGPSGCGKTTLARIIATEFGCREADYHELNIADARGIDDARVLMSSMRYHPIAGPVSVYCLDECQGATPAFQDAILKALEDTPEHVVFILTTTEPNKLKKTIRNRCSVFEVGLLTHQDMFRLLQDVLEQEKVEFPREAVQTIANLAEGSPRQALTILDQVIDLPDEELMQALNRKVVAESSIIDLCRALVSKEPWGKVINILNLFEDGTDWEKFRYAVLSYMTKVLLSGRTEVAQVIEAFKEPFFNSGKAGFVLACYKSQR